ncbi:hypothetical protein CTB96_15195 [Cryobacterium arcticum]|uniref:Uncharacterized protein n=1 Tax=Cryobacterium arcticum TaxID=670052 RepID=A0A317ZN97_9MICO|nr:hypothetical protein CTB96_15195 [Cryobacterium arcticum]
MASGPSPAERRIGLLRWFHEGEEWLQEIIVGIVIDRSAGVWHLDLDGEFRTLKQSTWSLFQP